MSITRSSLVLLLGALVLTGPARGQDKPTLKDVLGRVQSEGETKAVQDLIDKLKGAARKPATPAPEPAAAPAPTPAATATPPPVASPAPPATAREPPAAAPPKVVLPAKPTPAAPPEAKPAEVEPPALRPDEAIKRAEAKQAPSIDLEIFFDYKSAEITPKSLALLTTLGRALSDARLADDSFLIAGHTDAKGGADYNLALSQRRAEAVRRFLIANFEIDAKKLVAKGYGFRHLKSPNDPLAGSNRRVQIVNLSKTQR